MRFIMFALMLVSIGCAEHHVNDAPYEPEPAPEMWAGTFVGPAVRTAEPCDGGDTTIMHFSPISYTIVERDGSYVYEGRCDVSLAMLGNGEAALPMERCSDLAVYEGGMMTIDGDTLTVEIESTLWEEGVCTRYTTTFEGARQ